MAAPYLSHSGDLGDIIFALPAVRASGVRTLYLLDLPDTGARERMNRARFEIIAPLLRCQDYLDQVLWTDDPQKNTHLNGFRATRRLVPHLAKAHLLHMGLSPTEAEKQWLNVEPKPVAEVVIARSQRHQQEKFPWPQFIGQFGAKNMAFVGLPDEHAAFCEIIHVDVPYFPTPTLLDLAQVIAGSRIFIGNQSCPAAIAEGLKHTMISECWPSSPDTRWDRDGRADVVDGSIRMPKSFSLK